MKILKKILSNRGQLSMEIGILVAAAVLVAVIAGFYYISNVQKLASNVGNTAENATTKITEKASSVINKISSINVS
ncbi:class III signal peptide-containing protein [Methanocaldococcus sp.]